MLLRSLIIILLFAFCLLMVSCNQATIPEAEKPKGVLRVMTVPADMPITVDKKLKGNSPSDAGQYLQIVLEEGEHKIEALKPINEEKDMYGEKTIFIAGDTVQTVTLATSERLTTFGEEEKARKINEAKAIAEEKIKKRELANKRREERLANIEAINKPHTDALNSITLESPATIFGSYSLNAKGCTVTVSQRVKRGKYVKEYDTYHKKVNAKNLDLRETLKRRKTIGTSLNGTSFDFVCKDQKECITVTGTDIESPLNYQVQSYVDVLNTHIDRLAKIHHATENIIMNCK